MTGTPGFDPSEHPRTANGQFAAVTRTEADGVNLVGSGSGAPVTAATLVSDRATLLDYAGIFEHETYEEDVERVFAQVESARIVAIWDDADEDGHFGNAEFVGKGPDGIWRRLHPQTLAVLGDGSTDAWGEDPSPSLLDLDSAPYHRQDLDDYGAARRHNIVDPVNRTTDDEGRCEHGYFLTGGTGVCPMPAEEH